MQKFLGFWLFLFGLGVPLEIKACWASLILFPLLMIVPEYLSIGTAVRNILQFTNELLVFTCVNKPLIYRIWIKTSSVRIIIELYALEPCASWFSL